MQRTAALSLEDSVQNIRDPETGQNELARVKSSRVP